MDTPFRVLYEDNHLLVIVKPVGMPCQADASGDLDVLTAAKGYIGEKYAKPGAVYLGLVHRLDRPVGGVMALARTSKAASRLSGQIALRQVEKGYVAVVHGVPNPAEGALVHWLAKDHGENVARVVREGTPGAKRAELRYSNLETKDGLTLVEIALGTGRSHQIRVQMAAAGWPLCGDVKYGGAKPGEMVALWARRLAFTHPTREEWMAFEAQMPGNGVWARFAMDRGAAESL